jgi:hypothetical protein
VAGGERHLQGTLRCRLHRPWRAVINQLLTCGRQSDRNNYPAQ